MPERIVDLRKINKGVYKQKNKVVVYVEVPHITMAGIKLYDRDSGDYINRIDFSPEDFHGDVVYICFDYITDKELMYVLYNDNSEFVDVYAKQVVFSDSKTFGVIMPEVGPMVENLSALKIPYEDSILYQVSIKGATMADTSAKSHKGTFKGFEKKIPYYRQLGITAVILMPVYCTVPFSMEKKSMYEKKPDYRSVSGNQKKNYWGFGKAFHFSLNPELSSEKNPYKEFAGLVNTLHKAHIECILIMQFEEGTTTSYICEVLTYWMLNFGIDGFRVIGSGLDTKSISACPYLKGIKLIFENFDFDNYRPNALINYKNIACLKSDYLINSRRFLKGDDDCTKSMSYLIRKNSSYFANICNITDFSGFTLNDLVSYNVKHNEANGEDNTDGTDYNYSWNCGTEGETSKKAILKLRKKQIRNATLLYMLSQGTPLIQGGDEVLNSQLGNNNPYCQDNEIGWITYRKDKAAKDYYTFLKNLIEFRKRHCILHQPKELMLFDYMSCKVPDVSFHGKEAFKMDSGPASREFGILYHGAYAKQYIKKSEVSVYIIYNMNWEKREFALPLKSSVSQWKLLYSTDGSTDENFNEDNAELITKDSYVADARTISILITDK